MHTSDLATQQKFSRLRRDGGNGGWAGRPVLAHERPESGWEQAGGRSSMLRLQRAAGNRAVTGMLSSTTTTTTASLPTVVQCLRQWNMALESKQEYEKKVEIYNRYKDNGIKTAGILEKAIKNREAQEDKNRSSAYSNRYDTKSDPDGGVPSNVEKVISDPTSYIKLKTGPKGKTSAYDNYASPAEKTLVAGWNYANQDTEGEGDRLPNSEILYQQYKGAGGSIATLTQVVRSSIQNEETLLVMDMCDGGLQKLNGKVYEAGTDDFHALLGSDNCKGVAYMLADHARESGGKAIASIKAYKDILVVQLT